MRKERLWKKSEEKYSRYDDRFTLRTMQLMIATQNLVEYFEGLGDTREDAEIKVTQISREISSTNGGAKLDYSLGDTQLLLDIITNIDQATYPFFDANAKSQLLGDLSVV